MNPENSTSLINALQHVYKMANYLANVGFTVAIIHQDEPDAEADFVYHTQLTPTQTQEAGQELTLDQKVEIRRFEDGCLTYRRETIEYEYRCKEVGDYYNPDFDYETNAAVHVRRKVLAYA